MQESTQIINTIEEWLVENYKDRITDLFRENRTRNYRLLISDGKVPLERVPRPRARAP